MAVTLDPAAATVASRLLSLLSELPSTPAEVAAEARDRGAIIEAQLPVRSAGQHAMPAVELDDHELIAIAGLLDLLSEMPSTPPDVAADATDHAALLWTRLDASLPERTYASAPERD